MEAGETVSGESQSLFPFRRRKHPPAWFVRWYFRHFIATDRCPCALATRFAPLRGRWFGWLVYWCSRMDDENERLDHLPFYAMVLNQNTTGSSAANVKVTWRQRGHG